MKYLALCLGLLLATNAPLFCSQDVSEEAQQEVVATADESAVAPESQKKACCGEHASDEEVCTSGKCEDCHQ